MAAPSRVMRALSTNISARDSTESGDQIDHQLSTRRFGKFRKHLTALDEAKVCVELLLQCMEMLVFALVQLSDR